MRRVDSCVREAFKLKGKKWCRLGGEVREVESIRRWSKRGTFLVTTTDGKTYTIDGSHAIEVMKRG